MSILKYEDILNMRIIKDFPVNVSPVNKLLVHSSTSFSNVAARVFGIFYLIWNILCKNIWNILSILQHHFQMWLQESIFDPNNKK